MKRLLKIAGLGILFGFFFLAIKYCFNMDDSTFKIFSWMLLGGILLLALIYDIVWSYPMRKKVLNYLKMIEDGKAGECLSEMEDMLKEAEEMNRNNTVRFYQLNLAAGYIEVRRYSDALDMLNKIPEKKLHGTEKLVFYLNLCTVYFMLDDREKFLEIHSKEEKLFASYEKNKNYKGNIAVIKILAFVCKGNIEEAKALLVKSKEECSNQRILKTLGEIENIIDKN